MKLYSLVFVNYGESYHTIAETREEALKVIYEKEKFSTRTKIYDSYEEYAQNGDWKNYYSYYWIEKETGDILITKR